MQLTLVVKTPLIILYIISLFSFLRCLKYNVGSMWDAPGGGRSSFRFVLTYFFVLVVFFNIPLRLVCLQTHLHLDNSNKPSVLVVVLTGPAATLWR